ncbi:hypothetical protein [Nitriliruptor alkaliphilus]|uniref:hypothetical protein n=1 Tax=Nitriliruptor alkaliphilus TaxID=427918 RepID=UPI0006976134|nr:hypothetical protein [Nitriliruptor alkaliphilus]
MVPTLPRTGTSDTGTLGTDGTLPDEAMLIDAALPRFDVTLVRSLVVDADVPATRAALLALDLMTVSTPLMDAALTLRTLPAR